MIIVSEDPLEPGGVELLVDPVVSEPLVEPVDPEPLVEPVVPEPLVEPDEVVLSVELIGTV